MNLWPVEHFFKHICHHFWVCTHPKVMTNMLKKVFNWSEVHLTESDFLQNPYFKRDTNLKLILFWRQGPKIYKAKTKSCTKVFTI